MPETSSLVIFSAAGLLLTLATLIFYQYLQPFSPFIALAGITITIVSFSSEIVQKNTVSKLKQEMSKLSQKLKHEIKNRLPTTYTPTSQDNWAYALELISKMRKNWRGYDISSYPNIRDFENKFLEKAGECIFFRIIACEPDLESETAKWLERILDTSKDKEGKYDKFRKAIRNRTMKILHLPHSVHADFFIVCDDAGHAKGVVFGFPKSLKEKTYQSGMQIELEELVTDFRDFFMDTVWEEAKQHLRNVKEDNEKCPICQKFIGASDDTLEVKE